MRHLLTSLALLATFAAAGQTTNPFPYNPDADADGWISVNDLLSLLSIFTSEFTPESWETDSLSAAVVLNGNISYFECQRSCHELEGHWRMADMDAFGKHWNLVAGVNANHWVNSNSSLGSHDYNEFFEINGNGSIYSVNSGDLSLGKKCMCHLQSSPFVPDVLTSETAGLQEQIDALDAQYDQLLIAVQNLDSAQTSFLTDSVISPSGSQYSLECVEMGWSPLCPVGLGIEDYVTLGPSESGDWGSGFQYHFRGEGYLSGDNLRMDPKWRKFKIDGPIPEETQHVIIRRTDNSLSGGTYAIDLFNEGGEWFFYAFANGSNCSYCCAYGLPIDLPDGEHLSLGGSTGWEYSIQIFIPADGFYIDTGIGAVFKRY